MNKIDQIKEAIEKALRRESKLTPLALSVPALSSLNIRHLMNNLGSLATYYAEIGVHRGGLFCSTICNNENLKMAFAIDNWASDEASDEKAKPDFEENLALLKPQNLLTAIFHCDAFPPNKSEDGMDGILPRPIDLYLYDASHDEDSQSKALTYWIGSMADEFIFCVDDYDWREVQEGTERGIKESGAEVLYSNIWVGNDHDNNGAWNGFAVFLLKKKL